MTAHDDERLLVEAVEAGASGFLGKEEAADEVLAAAKAAADGEVLIDPTILTRLLHQVAIEREARSSANALLNDLTEREREILQLLAEGLRNDDIAGQAVHQPSDGADPRPQHPGQAAGAFETRGRGLRRQARRHHRLSAPRGLYPTMGMHPLASPADNLSEPDREAAAFAAACRRRPESTPPGLGSPACPRIYPVSGTSVRPTDPLPLPYGR